MSSDEKYLDSPRVIDPLTKVLSSSIENGKTIILNNDKYIIIQKLGEGGFGSVYKCADSQKREYALKKITANRSDKAGTPCLFEASVMSTYTHPSLNRALLVESSMDGLYILEDVAKCDLHGLISENFRNGTFLNINQLKNITYRIGKGLSFLHDKGLVHGDIKSNNILYFSETDIRITDFNLTTMVKWKSSIHLCTSMYRPLEIWRNDKDWTEKIDIWAYGCLMYELLYGKLLFPWQGPDKTLDKKKYINCIIEWANFNSPGKLNIKQYDVPFNQPNINSDLIKRKTMTLTERDMDDRDKNSYINLMLRCLQVIDKSRPSIDTILSDVLFSNIRSKPEYKELNNKHEQEVIKVNKDLFLIIENEIRGYVNFNDKELLRLATNICSSYTHITKFNTHLIKKVSVWIAKKLLRIDSSSQMIPNLEPPITREKFLQTELSICKVLGFKLH